MVRTPDRRNGRIGRALAGAVIAVRGRMRAWILPLTLCLLAGCLAEPRYEDELEWVSSVESSLTAAQRRTRAAQIRDAAAANGIEQGWLLAGIADAETSMSHCHSELTWACMGPSSPDCGGGPVVAGAGDGPCSLRQGGLGMFQFDAGTYDDTLRREGDRILSIAGNVAAAVDFVVGMVIRSEFISGVDDRAGAIAWMNGVRVDNARFDPWVRTVTRYYNGCRTTSSCWPSRYASYRDKAAGVYSEMGAEFWQTRHDLSAEYVNQTFPLARDPFELAPRQEQPGHIEMRNTGTATWRPGQTFLGTTMPRDAACPFAGPDWVGPNRPATVDRVVPPGETGRFAFTVRAPDAAGDYPQFFTLVQEGVAWFSDQGGPPDGQLQIRLTVTEAPACPAGTGATWTCDGDDRVRCEVGMTEREACEHGCDASGGEATCAGAPIDADGDGHDARFDCDDGAPDVHPSAFEECGDGIDQNCDGEDRPCEPDVPEPPVTDPGGGVDPVAGDSALSGGCSAGGARPSLGGLALLAVVGLRRRRR